jgi:ABC-2 type transport system permease protein
VLPLTYLNNGLRDTMVFGNISGALFNLEIIALLAAVFVIVGAYISKWTND